MEFPGSQVNIYGGQLHVFIQGHVRIMKLH